MTLPKNILVATDFSDSATAALDYAVELAAKLDARVHVLNVVGVHLLGAEYGIAFTPDLVSTVYEANRKGLERIIADRAGKVPFGPALLETGEPHAVIGETATKIHADLIVMGTHGRRGFRRLLIGSVAESVARTATCPVLLVRGAMT
jgi:nucleotide-binding universal stress UspA family protein